LLNGGHRWAGAESPINGLAATPSDIERRPNSGGRALPPAGRMRMKRGCWPRSGPGQPDSGKFEKHNGDLPWEPRFPQGGRDRMKETMLAPAWVTSARSDQSALHLWLPTENGICRFLRAIVHAVRIFVCSLIAATGKRELVLPAEMRCEYLCVIWPSLQWGGRSMPFLCHPLNTTMYFLWGGGLGWSTDTEDDLFLVR